MSKIVVTVPATSANIGPGFDCLGIALNLYNKFIFEKKDDFEYINVLEKYANINNLVVRSAIKTYDYLKVDIIPFSLEESEEVPISRGLGSSATCIVAGILAANYFAGEKLTLDEMLNIATSIEGHPDNVTPAIVGGLVFSSIEEDGSIIYRKLNWPKEWKLTVCIPDFELSTSISRSVIPKEIPLSDAIFNLKHSAMLIYAIETKDEELMKRALNDKIHQPYRMKLIPGMNDILESFKHEQGVLGAVLSGAGPTLLVISKDYNTDKIKSNVKEIWNSFGISSEIRTLDIEEQGAVILD